MPAILSPKESGEFVVKHAKHITVNQQGIDKIIVQVRSGIKTGELSLANFSQNEHHPKVDNAADAPEMAINWIFLIDTLNFCFWKTNSKQFWSINKYTGYFALCSAVNRAIANGINIIDPKYYATIGKQELLAIFRSDDDGQSEIPLIDKRIECLHEVGHILIEKYNGQFLNVIKSANGSAIALLNIITSEFPCFRDTAEYEGQSISIYKRAQILIGDLWSCFKGDSWGKFNDINELTMFADYRVPQVLVHFGALQYTDELMDTLKKDTILENGSAAEIEIRCASIYIVEKVKEGLLAAAATSTNQDSFECPIEHINSILIDHYLWDYRRKYAMELESIPFHKTLSIYY